MLITDKEYNNSIINMLTKTKLSYETIIHNKVYKSDIIFAIPQGIKCYAYFNYYDRKPCCALIDIINNKFVNIRIEHVFFDKELAMGTLLYGTYFKDNFFAIENIYNYKGYDCYNQTWQDKLIILKTILKSDLLPNSYNNFIIFKLPYLHNNINIMSNKIKHNECGYIVDKVVFMLFKNYNKHLALQVDILTKLHHNHIKDSTNNFTNVNNTNNTNNTNNVYNINNRNNSKNNGIFYVKAQIENDLYDLYCLNTNNELILYDIASVPNYNTSVLLNKLFRNIKENANLDTLEESDDEEDFQNENIDRYVDINKKYKMLCEYNYKFKKWSPVKLVDDKTPLFVKK